MRNLIYTITILAGILFYSNVHSQTTPKTTVYPEPYAPAPLPEELQGGEYIPNKTKWTKKQVDLNEKEGYIFHNNLALAVTKKMMFGAINEDKKWVINPVFYNILEITGLDDKLLVKNKTSWGVINLRGREIISLAYDTISQSLSYGSLIAKKTNGKFGMVNFYNEAVIAFIYDNLIYNAYDIYDSEKDETIFIKDQHIAAKKNGKWGFVDSTGNQVLPFEYDDVTGGFSDGLAGVKKGGLWGYIDVTGKVIIPFKYKIANPFAQGSATVSMSADEEDYDSMFSIDTKGKKLNK